MINILIWEEWLTETLIFNAGELADNDVKIVQVGDVEIGVFRKNNHYFAYRNICPHQGGPVCEGMIIPKVTAELYEDRKFRRHNFDTDEMHFVCPWHGWEFKLETGEAAGDPSIRLRRYTISERDGAIYVDI